MEVSRLFAILGFIIIGIGSRLLPHPPNCTSMNAIALLSFFYLGRGSLVCLTVFLTLFFSDIVCGFHSTMPFVYLSYILMILIGCRMNRETPLYRIPMACVTASILFFLLTNFGVWFVDFLYPRTLKGLILCYLSALPFLLNQILGDLCYSSLFIGCIAFSKHGIQSEKFAVSIKA